MQITKPLNGVNPLVTSTYTVPYIIEGKPEETRLVLNNIRHVIQSQGGKEFPLEFNMPLATMPAHDPNNYREQWVVYPGRDAVVFRKGIRLAESLNRFEDQENALLGAIEQNHILPRKVRDKLVGKLVEVFDKRYGKLTEKAKKGHSLLRRLQRKIEVHGNDKPLPAQAVLEAMFKGSFNAFTGKILPNAKAERQSA